MGQSSGHSTHNPAVMGLKPTLTTGWISFSFVASFDSSTREPASLLPVSVSLFSNFHQLFACSLQLVSETITLACCCEDRFGSCLIQSVITFMIKPIIICLLLCSCPILLITHDNKLNWTPLVPITITVHITAVLFQSFLLRCAAHSQLSMDLTFIGFFNQVLMLLIYYSERSLQYSYSLFHMELPLFP